MYQQKEVVLKDNGAQIAQDLVWQSENIAMFKSAQSNADHHYVNDLTLHLQTLVLKIGLIVSECLVSPKMSGLGNYLNSIDYLCHRVIRDDSLYRYLKADDVNGNANTVKHTIEHKTSLDFDEIIRHYNELISKTIAVTRLNPLKTYYIVVGSKKDLPDSKPQGNVESTVILPSATMLEKKNDRQGQEPISDWENEASVTTPTGVVVKARFIRGEGVIQKGLGRKEFIAFSVSVSVDFGSKNTSYVLKNIEAVVLEGQYGLEKKFKLEEGKNKIEIPKYYITSNRVNIKLLITYRIKVFTTKTVELHIGGLY